MWVLLCFVYIIAVTASQCTAVMGFVQELIGLFVWEWDGPFGVEECHREMYYYISIRSEIMNKSSFSYCYRFYRLIDGVP